MVSTFINYKNSRVHYRKSGSGSKLAICFHGFGTFAQTFDWIAEHVPDHCFIAFDLPFHGLTEWNEKEVKVDGLIDMLDHCPEIKGRPFSLVGYSMGGRISLSILQHIPDRITRLLLLAPDGLHMNAWYWFATQTRIGNKVFYQAMHKPDRFVKLVRKSARWHMVSEGVMKFIDRYLDDKIVRTHVYDVWTAFRNFRPDLKKIALEIKQRNIPVTLVYGKFDNVIPFKPGQNFANLLGPICRLTVLECGHQVLHIRNAQYIADSFLSA